MTSDSIEYRPVVGWPAYRVGSDGSIWSCLKQLKGVRRMPWAKTDEWHLVNPATTSKGYKIVSLYDRARKRKKHLQLHRLVLEAFVGPCPTGMQACHFPDRNPANCRLDNLRWDTPKSNHSDRIAHGSHLRGESNGMCKIPDQTVREIRKRYLAAKGNQKSAPRGFHLAIASEFGISASASRHIAIGSSRPYTT